MELSQLRYFITVARTQHLTRASEELRISQPALSKAISRLEEELEVKLFDRTANGITLNTSGKLYLDYVQRAMETLDSGRNAVRSSSGTVGGTVRIMTSCSGLLQPAIRQFLSSHHEIHYHQYRYATELIAEQLELGSADFAISTSPITSAKFQWTRLVQDELYITVAKDHPFFSRDYITMEELRDQPLVVSNNLLNTHAIIMEGFARLSLTPRIDYELNNPPLTQQLIQECRGISFVPGLRTDQLPLGSIAAQRLIPVEGHPFPYELGILKLRHRFQSPAATLLEQFLVEWFQAAENWTRTARDVRVL